MKVCICRTLRDECTYCWEEDYRPHKWQEIPHTTLNIDTMKEFYDLLPGLGVEWVMQLDTIEGICVRGENYDEWVEKRGIKCEN